MDDLQRFKSQLDQYFPSRSQLLLTSTERRWQGFVALCFKLNPFDDYVLETADATNFDRLTLQLSGSFQLEHVFNGQFNQGKSHPGRFALLPKGFSSTFRWNCPATVLQIYFFPSLLFQVASEINQSSGSIPNFQYFFNEYDPLIQSVGLSIVSELQSRSSMGRLYVESLVYTLIIHLARNYSTSPLAPSFPQSGLTPHQLRKVRDIIHDRLNEDLSLTELATTLGLSVSYFSRQFKQSTGLSPHQYLIQCRVERAKAMLIDGELTTAEIAHEVGFVDQSHLTRHFQQVFGISPRVVLQQSKNVQKKGGNVQDGEGGLQYSIG